MSARAATIGLALGISLKRKPGASGNAMQAQS